MRDLWNLIAIAIFAIVMAWGFAAGLDRQQEIDEAAAAARQGQAATRAANIDKQGGVYWQQ